MKIHFFQKVLKKWSSFRKKLLYIFPLLGGGGGPDPKVEISTFYFYFFFNPSLRDANTKKYITFFLDADNSNLRSNIRVARSEKKISEESGVEIYNNENKRRYIGIKLD